MGIGESSSENLPLVHYMITCPNPAQPDARTTYLRALAPIVLGLQYFPKCRVLINEKLHHLGCPRSPKLALPHPSYA